MKRDQNRGMSDKAPADGGMDELFAVLGYKVKSSDMAGVAVKLEQLEMAMGSTSVLSTDTVHYNPSDLSGWVESMLCSCCCDVISNPIGVSGESSGSLIRASNDGGNFIFDDDLRAIPGGAILGNHRRDLSDESESGNKRMKSSPGSEVGSLTSRPVVLVDSQEAGIRLVHTLMACAEAIQEDNLNLAEALVKNVAVLAASHVGAMWKVATHFAEALARRIYKIYPPDSLQSSSALQMHFYESGPYLKFAHFTVNQAILEAFAGESRVHVVDFSLNQGMQWPALIQALALRPGGPPAFRLTGIGPPRNDSSDVGWKLSQLARKIGIEFEFHGFAVDSLVDFDADLLEIRPEEAVAVNSVFELHRLLSRPGAIDRVLKSVRAINPRIVTVVEQEASHNGSVFLDRFNEALHYYSAMFDSLESSGQQGQANGQDLAMTEVYLGRQICNVVACDGADRVERHETLAQWRQRLGSAGFGPAHLGSNAFKQASVLLAVFSGGDGYRVEENEGCLMLGWHTRPLIATSAWRVKAAE